MKNTDVSGLQDIPYLLSQQHHKIKGKKGVFWTFRTRYASLLSLGNQNGAFWTSLVDASQLKC